VFKVKKDSMDVTGMRNMLTAYRLLERTDDAIRFGQTAVQHYPDDASLWSTYADALNKAGRMTDALAALDRIAKIDPAYNINGRKATWLIAANDIPGAIAAIEKGAANNELTEQQVDVMAQLLIQKAYNEKEKQNQHQAALDAYREAEKLIKTPQTRGMLAFFRGYSIYQIAVEREKPETLQTAQATLPMFRQVISLMQEAAAYPQVEGSRKQVTDAVVQYIDIQEAIIKRGR
jgi:tetratricopeptide (TPR) repeat protein